MLTDRDRKILNHVEEYGFITINQTHKIFVNNAKYGYDIAGKRLLKMCNDTKLFRCSKNPNHLTNEKIYYKEKMPSPHDIILMDFYAELVFNKAEIIEFKKEPTDEIYKANKMRPDAFVHFAYKDYEYIFYVEVVFTHQVDYSKYEALKTSGVVQNKYDVFPSLVVISSTKKYMGNVLNVRYLDHKMSNFVFNIL